GGEGLFGGAGPGRPKVAWLFSGQGGLTPGVGRQLYQAEPAFRRALDRCAAVLDGRLDRPLVEALEAGEAARPGDAAWAQPALFALQVSLAQMYREWGLEPD